jgi:plasmid stability protein
MAKMIQIRNVPDDLHTKLKVRAAQKGMSLSEYLLTEVEKIAEVPTVAELAERIRSLPPVKTSEDSATVIRHFRDAE